jgi:hypothetical protein
MHQDTEPHRIGQFYPADEDCLYFLYDGPDDFGLRVTADGAVTIGPHATIDGEFPNFRVSLRSGMAGIISGGSMLIGEGASAQLEVPLAALVQRALEGTTSADDDATSEAPYCPHPEADAPDLVVSLPGVLVHDFIEGHRPWKHDCIDEGSTDTACLLYSLIRDALGERQAGRLSDQRAGASVQSTT